MSTQWVLFPNNQSGISMIVWWEEKRLGLDRPELASWVPRSPASNLNSDLKSELQMPDANNTKNSSTSRCCTSCKNRMDMKRMAQSLAPEGGLIYTSIGKEKEKENLTAFIAPPWPCSQSLKMCWKAGEAKSMKSRWIEEHRNVLNREMRRKWKWISSDKSRVPQTRQQRFESQDSHWPGSGTRGNHLKSLSLNLLICEVDIQHLLRGGSYRINGANHFSQSGYWQNYDWLLLSLLLLGQLSE